MILLGIDTSTGHSAAAVSVAGEVFEGVAEVAPSARPGHARELLPKVADALAAAGLAPDEIEAIGVGVGPGTFTGVRIAVASARGLAQATGAQLRPVASTAALAAGIDAPLAAALIDGGRGELFAAVHAGLEARLGPFVGSVDEVAERLMGLGDSLLCAGNGALRFRESLEAAGLRVAAQDSPAHVVAGAGVCRVAEHAQPAAPEAVVPDYLREPDAKPR